MTSRTLEDIGDALLKSSMEGNFVVVQSLIDEGAPLDYKSKDGDTPLIFATKKNRREVAELLLDAGADESAADKWGRTPIILAAINNSFEITALLLKAGASVNAQDEMGNTALIAGVRHNHKETIIKLLQAGADINMQDKWGNTALSFAASHNLSEISEILLSSDSLCDINKANKDGNSPLHLAVAENGVETARLLVRKGADIEARNKKGITPLKMAESNNAVEAIKNELSLILEEKKKKEDLDFKAIGEYVEKQNAQQRELLAESKGMSPAIFLEYLKVNNLLNGVQRFNLRERRIKAMRARDKKLSLALQHEESRISYVPSDESPYHLQELVDGAEDGTILEKSKTSKMSLENENAAIVFPNKDDVLQKLESFLESLENYRETHLIDNVEKYFANLAIADELSERKEKLWVENLDDITSESFAKPVDPSDETPGKKKTKKKAKTKEEIS